MCFGAGSEEKLKKWIKICQKDFAGVQTREQENNEEVEEKVIEGVPFNPEEKA